MPRPKGSKNKIQNPLAENVQVVQPESIPQDELQSIQEYNAILHKQDETLDGFIAKTETTFNEVEAEFMPIQSIKIEKQLLSLMSQIHTEVADSINNARIAIANGFSANKIDYILDNPNENYYTLIHH